MYEAGEGVGKDAQRIMVERRRMAAEVEGLTWATAPASGCHGSGRRDAESTALTVFRADSNSLAPSAEAGF